jgi:hypothetical protein
VTTRRVLLTLIAGATLIFSGAYVATQAYRTAALVLVLGSLWFILEYNQEQDLATVFLLCFVGIAIWASLNDLPAPVLLFGLSSSLAAWDLSRFRSRAAQGGQGDTPPSLETQHLRKLANTAVVGFLLALLPLLVSLPVNFLMLAVLVFLTIVVLRNVIVQIRPEDQNEP